MKHGGGWGKRLIILTYFVGGKMQTTLENYQLSYDNNYDSYDSTYDYMVYDLGFVFDKEDEEESVNEGEQKDDELEEIFEEIIEA